MKVLTTKGIASFLISKAYSSKTEYADAVESIAVLHKYGLINDDMMHDITERVRSEVD